TMAMPRLAGGVADTSAPSMTTRPEVESSSPAMTLSKVDLPQPDGPTKTTNSPSVTSRLMPFSTSTGPKAFFTFSIFSEPTASFLFLEFYGLAAAHALIGGEADGERLDGIVHVAGEVDIFADGLEQEGLFEVAEFLVARL